MTLQKKWSTSRGCCDLCVEFAHFLSNFVTLERKKNLTNKNPVSGHHFDADETFVSRVSTQDNLITAPTELDDTVDFFDLLMQPKAQ